MTSTQNTHDEQSPLLEDDPLSNDISVDQPTPRAKHLTIISCFTVRALFLIAAALIELPLLQLQETILCDRLNAVDVEDPHIHPLPDPQGRCKQENVQKELSILQSWVIISQLLPGLIVSIPMGIAADRYGRKIVLGLALLGTTLSMSFAVLVCAIPEVFPLRLIWIAPIFTFIGGGEIMVLTMVYTIIADVTIDSQRSFVFSYLFATSMIGGMLANPLAYILIKRSPWLSIYTGLVIMLLCIIIGFSVPETLKKPTLARESSESYDNGNNHKSQFKAINQQVVTSATRFRSFINTLVKEERNVGFLLLSLLLTTFGKDSALMLMQYITVKFRWEWSEAGLVSSLQQAVSLILLTVIIPLVTKKLLQRGMSSQSKDLLIMRISGIVQVAGGFTIALAPTSTVLIGGVAVSGLTTGYGICARSLMTSLMSRDIAMLYTTISMLEMLGILIANPLLSASFRLGLQWGRDWVGLPFMLAGVLYTGALCIIAWVRIDDNNAPVREESGSDSVE